MKSIDGQFLNINPVILLTGPQQETVADQLVTSIIPNQVSSVNPFVNKLRTVTEAAIAGPVWYLFADPQVLPCFVYGFLAGATGPRIRDWRRGVRDRRSGWCGFGATARGRWRYCWRVQCPR